MINWIFLKFLLQFIKFKLINVNNNQCPMIKWQMYFELFLHNCVCLNLCTSRSSSHRAFPFLAKTWLLGKMKYFMVYVSNFSIAWRTPTILFYWVSILNWRINVVAQILVQESCSKQFFKMVAQNSCSNGCSKHLFRNGCSKQLLKG